MKKANDSPVCPQSYNMLPINQLLNQGRYRVNQSLGQNGAGLLYEAYDNVLQSNVILKEIAVKLGKVSTVSQQETLKLAFAGEAKTLQEINHEAFLKIHDYFSEIDRHYFVMEAISESNLKELLEKNGRAFAFSSVIRWAEKLLDALNYLHTQTSIVHRDIKPQNLKITADGKIKLSAPGISKNLSEKLNKTDANQPSAANNLHFLPLEQIWEGLDSASQKVITNSYDEKSEDILKQPTNAASDIYSLGATLYYLLTARLPIDALERSIDILEGKADPLPSPHQLNPSIPLELSNILMKALEIKRENRFGLTSVMRQVLRTAVLQIKEREAEEMQAEEVREQEEALEELRLAEQNRIELERRTIEQKTLELEAEQKRLESERQIIEEKKLKIEAERRRQEELLVKNRRETEVKTQKTEKVPVVSENTFLDDDILELDTHISASPTSKAFKETAPPISTAKVNTANVNTVLFTKETETPKEYKPSETAELFAETQKSGGGFWKIPVIAVAFLVFGGAGFGIWYSQKTSAENPNLAAPTQAISTEETTKPAPVSEPALLPTTQQPAETTTAVPATELIQTPATATPAKIKTAAVTTTPTPPKPKKQTTPPPQTAENQKKPVTVDDLINDN